MNVSNLCTTLMDSAELDVWLDLCLGAITATRPPPRAHTAACEIVAAIVVEKQRRRDNGEVIE